MPATDISADSATWCVAHPSSLLISRLLFTSPTSQIKLDVFVSFESIAVGFSLCREKSGAERVITARYHDDLVTIQRRFRLEARNKACLFETDLRGSPEGMPREIAKSLWI